MLGTCSGSHSSYLMGGAKTTAQVWLILMDFRQLTSLLCVFQMLALGLISRSGNRRSKGLYILSLLGQIANIPSRKVSVRTTNNSLLIQQIYMECLLWVGHCAVCWRPKSKGQTWPWPCGSHIVLLPGRGKGTGRETLYFQVDRNLHCELNKAERGRSWRGAMGWAGGFTLSRIILKDLPVVVALSKPWKTRRENWGNRFQWGDTANEKSPRWDRAQQLEEQGEDPWVCNEVSEEKRAGEGVRVGRKGSDHRQEMILF